MQSIRLAPQEHDGRNAMGPIHVRIIVACSKRSDSGERCGVEKVMKSRGGLRREVWERL